jgi:hypothetical protein
LLQEMLMAISVMLQNKEDHSYQLPDFIIYHHIYLYH